MAYVHGACEDLAVIVSVELGLAGHLYLRERKRE